MRRDRTNGRAARGILTAFLAAGLAAAGACSSSSTGAGSTTSGSSGQGGASTSGGPSSTSDASVTVGVGSGGAGGGCNPACAKGLTCVGGVCAGLIDFETIPGGAPMDGLTIDTQFKALYGVSFGFDKDGDGKPDPGASPVLAKVGDPETAFSYDAKGVGDTAAPGQDIGSYFLTDDGVVGPPPSPLIISYTTPVAAAYGQIIDIDGMEGWTIETRDASDKVLDAVVLNAGDPGTGDGIATPFSFKHASADIASLRLRYTGMAVSAVGLAFDNFSPTTDALIPK